MDSNNVLKIILIFILVFIMIKSTNKNKEKFTVKRKSENIKKGKKAKEVGNPTVGTELVTLSGDGTADTPGNLITPLTKDSFDSRMFKTLVDCDDSCKGPSMFAYDTNIGYYEYCPTVSIKKDEYEKALIQGKYSDSVNTISCSNKVNIILEELHKIKQEQNKLKRFTKDHIDSLQKKIDRNIDEMYKKLKEK